MARVIVRATELNNKNMGQACVVNWGSFVNYKIGQTLVQIGAGSLLQIRASVVTNWSSYYKLGQILKIRAIITNWGMTPHNSLKRKILIMLSYTSGVNDSNILRKIITFMLCLSQLFYNSS